MADLTLILIALLLLCLAFLAIDWYIELSARHRGKRRLPREPRPIAKHYGDDYDAVLELVNRR